MVNVPTPIFGLADERLFHLEFQTEHCGATLPRFLAYDGYLYKRYRRSIATVVCCSGGLNVARVRDQGRRDPGQCTYRVDGQAGDAETDQRRRDRLARGPCAVGYGHARRSLRAYWRGPGGRHLPRFPTRIKLRNEQGRSFGIIRV